MITAKFGGTAMTPTNLHFVKQCITPFHNAVVVSAVGREHPQDDKATDLLKQYFVTRDESRWDAFANKYRRLVEVNSIDVDVDKLLFDAHARATQYNLEYCMSLGEEMSAKIAAKYLSATYVEAEQIVRFGSRNLLLNVTLKSIADAFKGVDLAVTGGFYGGGKQLRKLFPRGGSDITGSLCAVAANACMYENWTDSYGVNVANPVKVFDVATVYSLSYDEMYSLARSGAEVLHPDAVKPCARFGIPIKIGNFYNPDGASTVVSNCPSQRSILSIAERKDELGNTVTTVLHSLDKHYVASFLADFLKDNSAVLHALGKQYLSERAAVISFACHGNIATITTDQSIIVPLYKQLKSSGLIR